MAKNPTFGSGVLFRNKGKLDKLNFEAARSPKAYDNAPDLTGKLGFTKAEANALMQYLKRAFENANEDSYGNHQDFSESWRVSIRMVFGAIRETKARIITFASR